VDISADALGVAALNAKNLGTEIQLHRLIYWTRKP